MRLYAVICQRIGSRKIMKMSSDWTIFCLHRQHSKPYSCCLLIPWLWTQITNENDRSAVMPVLIWVHTAWHSDGTPGRTFWKRQIWRNKSYFRHHKSVIRIPASRHFVRIVRLDLNQYCLAWPWPKLWCHLTLANSLDQVRHIFWPNHNRNWLTLYS